MISILFYSWRSGRCRGRGLLPVSLRECEEGDNLLREIPGRRDEQDPHGPQQLAGGLEAPGGQLDDGPLLVCGGSGSVRQQ